MTFHIKIGHFLTNIDSMSFESKITVDTTLRYMAISCATKQILVRRESNLDSSLLEGPTERVQTNCDQHEPH
jgi:hypothetical protein